MNVGGIAVLNEVTTVCVAGSTTTIFEETTLAA
jgi:hypothetical protein